MDTPAGGRSGWTRRRFLAAAGAVALGGTSAAVALYEASLRSGTDNGAVASPGARSLVAVASGPPAGATPGVSPRPANTAGRRAYRSRPDLTPPRIVSDVPPSGRVAPGYVFFTPANGDGQDGPMIADNTGDLVWLRPDSGVRAANFRVSRYQGEPVLTWWEGTLNGGIGAGAYVIADSSYRVIARVTAGNGRQADLHEFLVTPQGTALFFADEGVPASTSDGSPAPWQVMDCVVQEVDIASGRVLVEWHSADHIALDESYVAPPTQAGQIYDYVHANSIDVGADGSLLVSARNTSAVYSLDRSSGEIAWRLGGKRSDFSIGDGAGFGWQHDARWQPDGTVSMFDDEAAPGQSRAIVLRLDQSAMTASLERAYVHPQGLLATSQGNAQLLPNGNVFVGWGSEPFFSEFSRGGTLLYDASFPAAAQSYRDFRAEWSGRPTEPPAVAVEAAGPRTLSIYASWNGATDVAAWDVLAGDDPARLRVVASAPRSGFETAVTVATNAALVAVRARDGAGRTLGTSRLSGVPA